MKMLYMAEYVYHSVFVGLLYEKVFFPQTKAFSNVFGLIYLRGLRVFATHQHSFRGDSFQGNY